MVRGVEDCGVVGGLLLAPSRPSQPSSLLALLLLQPRLLPAAPPLRSSSLVARQLPQLGGVLRLRHGMVVEALGLEEDCDVPDMSPEVSDGVATVASADLGLEDPATAGVGAGLAELLPPGLITDGGSDGHLVPARQQTPPGTDEDAETGFLEDVDVVVVGVPHGPPAGVALGLLAPSRENVSAVTVGPLGPGVKTSRDLERFIVISLSEIFYYFDQAVRPVLVGGSRAGVARRSD